MTSAVATVDGGFAFATETTSYTGDSTGAPDMWIGKADKLGRIANFQDVMQDVTAEIAFGDGDSTQPPAVNGFSGAAPFAVDPAQPLCAAVVPQSLDSVDAVGTVRIQADAPFPQPPPPPHGGVGGTDFTVNGAHTAVTQDLHDTVIRFAAKQTSHAAALLVRVQSTQTPNPNDASNTSWTDLPNGPNAAGGGFMTYDASTQQYVLNATNYPLQNGTYFRAIAVAAGYPDSIANVVGPFNLASNTPHLGPTILYISRNGPVANIRFGVTETTIPSGVAVRIQATTTPATEASWTDIANGNLTADPKALNQFYLGLDDYPAGEGVFFRAVAKASGFVDSLSQEIGPITFILDPAATVAITITVPGGSASGSGLTIDNPVVVSSRSFNVTATALSGRSIKRLALKYAADVLQSFNGAAESGNTVQYTTNIPGDHLIEAVATDDLGVIGDAPPLHLRVAPQAPGLTYTLVQPGDWSNAANWRDPQGKNGVPGPNDFAVLSGNSVSLATDVIVNAVSLNGGTISGPGALTVTGFCTIAAGQVKNDLTIAAGATCELLNDADVGMGGRLTNNGRLKVHGKGGITGIPNNSNAKAQSASTSPNGFFDGLVAFVKNVGDMIFHRPAGGRKGSGSAPAPPPNPPPAPEVRQVIVVASESSGRIIADNSDGLIAQGGGNLVAAGGGNVVSHDGGSLIGQDGGGLIAQGGGNIVAQGGGNVVSNDGASLIGQDGGGIVATGGGNLVGNSGGTFKINSASVASTATLQAATAPSGFTQSGGELNLSQITVIGPFNLNGGVLSGSGLILGDLTNNGGYISPGHSAGIMAVTGNFTQGANGTLIVENGGPYPSQFDQLQVGGAASLGGNLDVKLINGYTPDPADTFSPLGYSSATGSFASVSGNAQATVNASGLLTSVDPAKPNPKTGQPLNIATRLAIQSGDNVLIAGFIVTGPSGSTKKVLIRGLGPSLAGLGVPGTISDPLLELHNPDGSVVINDNWQQGDTTQIPPGFAPSDPRESVVVATIGPGNYTAILKGAHGETGVGLAEVYDLDSASLAQLGNIATRGFVNTGDNVLIGGFIIGGTEPAKMVVRAIAPSLVSILPGVLKATTLELHDANGSVISNEGWRSTQESEILATALQPGNDNEAAILATLVPGNYTAIVRGKNNTTGIAVVEAYNLQ